jgi:hypothetical protein
MNKEKIINQCLSMIDGFDRSDNGYLDLLHRLMDECKIRIGEKDMNKSCKISNDYRLLRKLLDNGNEIVCFFDGEICKGKVLEDKIYYFSVHGRSHNNLSKECSQASFPEYMSQKM